MRHLEQIRPTFIEISDSSSNPEQPIYIYSFTLTKPRWRNSELLLIMGGVSLESVIIFFGLLGNIMSGLLYLSPADVFWRILKRKSTEEFESIPYVSKLLNAYFWVYYGLIKPKSLLVATINIFGGVVEVIFLTIFLLYAPPRMKTRTAILVAVLDVGFPAAAILLTQFLLHGEKRIDVAGLFCVIFSMIAYASPLSAMIPNGTGFLLGTAQLILYGIYWKPKSQTPKQDVEDEEDQKRQPLINDSSNLNQKN
ncbi:bidirectional sugar transporter SWEET17 isoform X2 [Ziziphus jujuba]|uniref:Bidirectional sugar transporter SWEET n=1 Tax=Ziziphus jujuba TaxID=326968 RepID=A0A6P3ZA74_ZIZJJ|nr:bidirectional sugar transporter SWEET17 isoform X2 [Ziziphus jujuba]